MIETFLYPVLHLLVKCLARGYEQMKVMLYVTFYWKTDRNGKKNGWKIADKDQVYVKVSRHHVCTIRELNYGQGFHLNSLFSMLVSFQYIKKCTWKESFLRLHLWIILISFQKPFPEIWVIKLRVGLICDCSLSASVYSIHLYLILHLLMYWLGTPYSFFVV